MTKEYPSTKFKKKWMFFQAIKQGSLVIRSSGFIWIWAFRNSSFALGTHGKCGNQTIAFDHQPQMRCGGPSFAIAARTADVTDAAA